MTYYNPTSGTAGCWHYIRNGASGNVAPGNNSNGLNSFNSEIGTGVAWAVATVYGHWTAEAEL